MKRLLRILWPLVLVLMAGPPWLAQEPGFQIIAHPLIDADSVSRTEASRMFLRQVTLWKGSDETVRPVDLVASSPVREVFSNAIHRKKLSAIKAYWRQQIFSGRSSPPPELRSDQEVVQFVSARSGAIGYVSEDATLEGVKVLTIE